MYIYIHTRTSVCIYIYVYIYMQNYLYTHTHHAHGGSSQREREGEIRYPHSERSKSRQLRFFLQQFRTLRVYFRQDLDYILREQGGTAQSRHDLMMLHEDSRFLLVCLSQSSTMFPWLSFVVGEQISQDLSPSVLHIFDASFRWRSGISGETANPPWWNCGTW